MHTRFFGSGSLASAHVLGMSLRVDRVFRQQMTAYHLLTGATGLLGSNLLRDFLLAQMRVAVLVRSSKLEGARQRIETILSRWEKQAGYTLPRPIILEGDLSDERFKLQDEDLRWVAKNCHSLVQNAASVTYHGEKPNEEPWRTNVGGTRNALEFCRQVGIRQYHHVSTAYVCGKRDDRVYEREVDVGQDLNTDYERSKLEGEKLIRAADHIDPPTIYRAAIIIGDSRTGHTPTFHGFYVPLKLVHTMFRHILLNDLQAKPLQEAIQIEGHERKNLVPVDWVSAVTTHVVNHPEHHGQTYHLAPEHPVTSDVMRDSMVQAFLMYGDLAASADKRTDGWSFNQEDFVRYFRDQMAIYESYWKDDPVFDISNTKRAAPHLPCPNVDTHMLVRLCKYALESNFGWPRPHSAPLEFDVFDYVRPLLNATDWSEEGTRVGLQVNGPGGGQWQLLIKDGRAVSACVGCPASTDVRMYMNTNTFSQLARHELTVEQAVQTARTVIEGNNLADSALAHVLEDLVTGPAAQHDVLPA